MSYPNAYLRDFVPVLGQILKETATDHGGLF